jgi:hypothetical protein
MVIADRMLTREYSFTNKRFVESSISSVNALYNVRIRALTFTGLLA